MHHSKTVDMHFVFAKCHLISAQLKKENGICILDCLKGSK